MKHLRLILVFLLAAPVYAGMHDDVGFSRLKSELGVRLPTGKGISVGQVESAVEVTRATGTEKTYSWMPNNQVPQLQSYKLIDRSGAPAGVHSSHATAVAMNILGRGRNQGLASQIHLYEVYSVSGWFGIGMLRARTSLAPAAGAPRVINHSWVASGKDTRLLRRSDWLIEHDEVIQVVGVRNDPSRVNDPLLAAAVNVIAVGRSDGKHGFGTPAVSAIYEVGRVRPHLVAPLVNSSVATPVVTSAVILLLETASNPALSSRSEPFRNRNGEQIYDAARSEVIRAVLMAAADRETDNSKYGNIVSYRGSSEHRADNGLDTRYGAGQLNIYNAWHILNAGEQEDNIGNCGFDYEPGLGGAGTSDASRHYVIPEVSSSTRLTATLSWNLLFPFSNATRFDVSAVLNDLDLSLFEINDGQKHLVQTANSRIDTTETIDALLEPGRRYRLVVSRVDQGSVAQDYAIAWQMVGGGSAR